MRHHLFFKKQCSVPLSNGFLIFPEHATQLARLPFFINDTFTLFFPLAVVYSCAKLESEEALRVHAVCVGVCHLNMLRAHYFCFFIFVKPINSSVFMLNKKNR